MNGVEFISPVVYKMVVPTERREFTPVDTEISTTPYGEPSRMKEARIFMASV